MFFPIDTYIFHLKEALCGFSLACLNCQHLLSVSRLKCARHMYDVIVQHYISYGIIIVEYWFTFLALLKY